MTRDGGPATGARPALTPYRSTVEEGGEGFHRLLRAEWTKLRSVPRWRLIMLAAVALTILVALLSAAGAGTVSRSNDTGGNGRSARPALPAFHDQGRFVHRPLFGDGTIVARVASQRDTGARAKAGLMIRSSTRPGSPHAAIVVTPGHGVRMLTAFTTDIGRDAGTAPRWIKLTRSGRSVTGYDSVDGITWRMVGRVDPGGLSRDAVAGLFVASPPAVKTERQFGGESVIEHSTVGTATFDHVRLAPARPQPDVPWRDDRRSDPPDAGAPVIAGGTFTLSGAGDLGRDEFANDVTRTTLSGVVVGLAAVVALAVLVITSEFRRAMIRTTFAATPHRGRVLAAKALVVGGVTFAAGLVAAFGAFLLTMPVLRAKGLMTPPLSEGPVLRALVGTAALLAAVAVLSLAVAAIVRRSAPAITIVLLALLVPQFIATGLPLSSAMWLQRLTPAAGFAAQQTLHRYDTALGPWAGLGVLAAYAALALVAAIWLVRRRDA